MGTNFMGCPVKKYYILCASALSDLFSFIFPMFCDKCIIPKNFITAYLSDNDCEMTRKESFKR